jgi:hypothetical protein
MNPTGTVARLVGVWSMCRGSFITLMAIESIEGEEMRDNWYILQITGIILAKS